LKWQKNDPFMLGRTDEYWCNWSYKDRLTNSEFKTSLVFKPYWSVLEELIVTETLLSIWFNITSRFCITWDDFPYSTVSPILKKARNAREKNSWKKFGLVCRIAWLWQNSNYISKFFDSYRPSDVSTLICFRHTFQ
jgi:hypothetical protein